MKTKKHAPSEKTLSVSDLRKFLELWQKSGELNGKTEVWIALDVDGKKSSPLILFDRFCANVGIETDKSKILLFPCRTTHLDAKLCGKNV